MFLVIDEIANLSSDHTLLVYSPLFNWYQFPNNLKVYGPQQAFYAIPTGWDLIQPADPDPSKPAPSTEIAKKLVPVRNSCIGMWPPDIGSTPAFMWGAPQWPYLKGAEDMRQGIAIVRSDGSVVFTLIQLLTYLQIIPPHRVPTLPIGDKGSLGEVGLPAGYPGPPNWNVPLDYALRLSTWLLDAKSAGQTMKMALFHGIGIEQPFQGPAPKSRTILFSQQSRLRDFVDEDRTKVAIPSSPMQHLRIGVGDTLLLRFGPARDFTGEEIAYEIEYALQHPTVAQTMAYELMVFFKLGLEIAKRVDWEELTADEAYEL